jgi:hypothetical protein
MTALLILGILFPAISLLTLIASLFEWWKHKKHSSPIFIPFIGPVLLTFWVISFVKHLWLIPIVWVCDVGTVAFIIAIPRLLSDWWNACSFTRILNLHSSSGIQSAQLSFHTTGRYLLQKKWHHPPGKYGTICVGDAGAFTRTGDIIEMKSDWGWSRTMRFISDGHYLVSEEVSVKDKNPDYSIANWTFENKS